MNFPEDLKYTHDHEWVRLDGEIATVGVTDFAQSELGDVVFIELNAQGDSLEAKDIFGTIEAVKTVSDLFMPVGGEIVEVNDALNDAPEKVNEDPYGDGWMIKIKIKDESEVEALLGSEAYKETLNTEA